MRKDKKVIVFVRSVIIRISCACIGPPLRNVSRGKSELDYFLYITSLHYILTWTIHLSAVESNC